MCYDWIIKDYILRFRQTIFFFLLIMKSREGYLIKWNFLLRLLFSCELSFCFVVWIKEHLLLSSGNVWYSLLSLIQWQSLVWYTLGRSQIFNNYLFTGWYLSSLRLRFYWFIAGLLIEPIFLRIVVLNFNLSWRSRI